MKTCGEFQSQGTSQTTRALLLIDETFNTIFFPFFFFLKMLLPKLLKNESSLLPDEVQL